MPAIAGDGYPIVEDVMLLARSIVNDTFPGALANGTPTAPGAGQILTDDPVVSPFTLPFIKSATRKLYREMGNSGAPYLIKDNVIVEGITVVNGPTGSGLPDPAVQVALTYGGYFDGTNTNNLLLLPSDVLVIEKLWERTSGTEDAFFPMYQSQDGLPSRSQMMTLGEYEWRGDALWMVGALTTRDLRLRYQAALPLVGANSDFTATSIPILDATDALAYLIASMYAAARGAVNTTMLDQKAEIEIREMQNRQIRAKQGIGYSRMPFGDHRSPDLFGQ